MSNISQCFRSEDVEVKSRKSIHEGFCSVKEYEIRQKYFNDEWSEVYSRELIAKPKAVAALPYDPKLDKVVLIEQLRVGAIDMAERHEMDTPWLIEIIAGIVDDDDEKSHKDKIRREIFEETGLYTEALLHMYDYFTTPGCSTERIELFCARVDSNKAKQFAGLKEEHEDIKVHVVSTEEAFLALRSGQINNAAAIIALQWLDLNMNVVNQQWGIEVL